MSQCLRRDKSVSFSCRFASDTDYLFTAQYIVEAKKIQGDCNDFIFRQKPGSLTASQARDDSFVSDNDLRRDKARIVS